MKITNYFYLEVILSLLIASVSLLCVLFIMWFYLVKKANIESIGWLKYPRKK